MEVIMEKYTWTEILDRDLAEMSRASANGEMAKHARACSHYEAHKEMVARGDDCPYIRPVN